MPPDRNRNTNAQGRQKSCTECVKSKRRCDLQQPSCLRCTRQNLTCIYPSRHQLGDTPSTEDGTLASTLNADDAILTLDLPLLPEIQDTSILDFDLDTGMESVDVLDNLLNSRTDESTLPLTRTVNDSDNEFSATHISALAYPRINYMLELLKQAPSMMVMENQTPWSHAHLYADHMPHSLQGAHAACALYIARNQTNAMFIDRHIRYRINEFLESPPATKPLEILARAQALLLYAIMFVTNGNIHLNSLLDTILPHLEALGYALHSLLEQEVDPPISPLPLYPATSARQAWKSFIFRESGRRTLAMIFCFAAICYVLCSRGRRCADNPALSSRITLSSHLWNADSAVDFAVKWNEGRHFLVRDLDLSGVLEAARPEDLDVFGRIMLVGVIGMDDVMGWFHSRGGSF